MMELAGKSTPSFSEFSPFIIPFQGEVIAGIDLEFDYSLGCHDVLLSGSVGSAKSLLLAHVIVKHCLMYPGARVLIGRRTLPDLKETLFALILEHLMDENLEEKKDYWVTANTGKIFFKNRSQIISRSWADKKFKKLRSLALSAAVIEELTENDEQDSQAFFELKQRIGRLPHIKEKWLLCATNPDSPRHWAYKYFFLSKEPTRHVYKSRTEDNPFLPPEYVAQLKRDLDPKQARRMLYGEWIEIDNERIYHSFDSDHNYIKSKYEVDLTQAVAICFDFNIGVGKPMSCAAGQYLEAKDEFHFFHETIIEGARTLDVLEELASKGILDMPVKFKIYGDATGEHKSTASIHSDYDIIKKFLANYKTKDGRSLAFEMCVPKANPPVRERHNVVNGYCLNVENVRRLFVYESCKVLEEGMRLTALKKGADYIEDDSFAYQHVTTAIGYFVVRASKDRKHKEAMKKAGF
ncbi:MAG: phage terminase large subunit [Bdellovibrio sp.]|nr:phage terminase large subunit [Bdellovibrio sp.]